MRYRAMQSILLSLVPALAGVPAVAAVTEARPDGFLLEVQAEVAAPPEAVYRALGQIGQWWGPDHTWSGDAANLSLALEAGGCFCERWDGGSVEHARVVAVRRNELLRLRGALGPLQSTAVSGVVTFTLKPAGGGTHLEVSHRVSGDSGSALDRIAPGADRMLVETVGRLERFVETGSPEAPSTAE